MESRTRGIDVLAPAAPRRGPRPARSKDDQKGAWYTSPMFQAGYVSRMPPEKLWPCVRTAELLAKNAGEPFRRRFLDQR